MAFCEQCGTPIPDGYTRCANCGPAPVQQQTPASAPAGTNPMSSINFMDILVKFNLIGLTALIFNILAVCLPVCRKTHIWEIADMMESYYIVAFAIILSAGAAAFGYIFNQKKISDIAGIVNLVAFLLVWFPFANFSVGFYLWLIGVLLQLPSGFVIDILKKNVK